MKRRRECVYGGDLGTLVWTRRAAFPLGMLESRMLCPRCESRRAFDWPSLFLLRLQPRTSNTQTVVEPTMRAVLAGTTIGTPRPSADFPAVSRDAIAGGGRHADNH